MHRFATAVEGGDCTKRSGCSCKGHEEGDLLHLSRQRFLQYGTRQRPSSTDYGFRFLTFRPPPLYTTFFSHHPLNSVTAQYSQPITR